MAAFVAETGERLFVKDILGVTYSQNSNNALLYLFVSGCMFIAN